MSEMQDKDTGEMMLANDLTNMEFEVFVDIGPSYSNKRDKTFRDLGSMAAAVGPTDPALQKIFILKQLVLMDGPNDDVREYANKQLIQMGVKEPQTDEELQFAEELKSRPQQPDPSMEMAKAEQMKATAKQGEVDNEKTRLQLEMAQLQQKDKHFSATIQLELETTRTTISKMQTEMAKMLEEVRLKAEALQLDRDRLNFDIHDAHEKNVVQLHSAQTRAKQGRYDPYQRKFVTS
jgi:hypothetical protein